MAIFTSAKKKKGGFPTMAEMMGFHLVKYREVAKKYAAERLAWSRRPKVKVGELVRISPGGRHAFFQTNVGVVRKEYGFRDLVKASL